MTTGRDEIDRLIASVYDQLRKVAWRFMASERPDHTLQPTALVHEAFEALAVQTRANWRGREHFLSIAAQQMRRILIDHARGNDRIKRDRRRKRPLSEASAWAEVDVDVLDLHFALDDLARTDEPMAKVVEMKFFGGMKNREVAKAMGISRASVDRKWALARSLLYRELSGEGVITKLDGHDADGTH